MFGHDLPTYLYQKVRETKKAYVENHMGKGIIGETLNSATIAVAVYRDNDSLVKTITDEERLEMNQIKKPFVIFGSTVDRSESFLPDRYTENAPFLNRPFWHGVFDCYTLLRDYYYRIWDLWLPTNLNRPFNWWNQGPHLYSAENAGAVNFYKVHKIKKYDAIIFNLGGAAPNHGAVVIDDNNTLLHHLGGRFSCVEPLSSTLRQNISTVYRSKTIEDILKTETDLSKYNQEIL
jgi:cell wall-associated NlpC family hydrolase